MAEIHTSHNFEEHAKDCINKDPGVRAVPRTMRGFVEDTTFDLVNHPPHYKDGGIEVIDFIEAKKLNYNRGNAVKYISRAGKKHMHAQTKFEEIQDLEKAVWYLQREITNLKRA